MLEDFVEWCRSRQRQLQVDDATCDILQRLVEAYRTEHSAADEPPQIRLTHQCRSNACGNPSCALCKNTLVKRCTRLVKQRYRDVEPVQALCKGLITCQLPEVPGSVTDQVTHFRVYLVDSSVYDELKSQLGRDPRWSELQEPHRRIVIRQTGQAATGIFQRVPSDHFPLATSRHQGHIAADIGGSGQSMVITVSSHKFTQRRKLGHFRLLVVAGCEASGASTSTDTKSARVLDSILPAVSEPFKVGTAPYVEEPLKVSYPIERLYGIGKNLEGVFRELRRHAAGWPDAELASKVVACLGPHQSGIETVEEFLQFATRLSTEPPVVDRLRTMLNAARLQEAVEHARQAVHPDNVPRIFTTNTTEGRWGLVYAVDDGGLQLDAGPIEYIFESAADNSRSRIEQRSKEASARQDLLRDLHALARASWHQDGHRNWNFVTIPTAASAPPPVPSGSGSAAADRQAPSGAWGVGPSNAQQQQVPAPAPSRGRSRGRGRPAAQAASPPPVSHPQPVQQEPYQQPGQYSRYGGGYQPLVPGQEGAADEYFLSQELLQGAAGSPPSHPGSESLGFMHIGPPSPSWAGAPPGSRPPAPDAYTGAPPQALAFLKSASSSPTASSPTGLTRPRSSPSAPTDLPSLDAGIGPGSPPPPSPFTSTAIPPDLLPSMMPVTLSAPNRIPAHGPYPTNTPAGTALPPAISDPHPHAGHHPATRHGLPPAGHHHAPYPHHAHHPAATMPEFTFTTHAARTITTTNHNPTFPTAATSPTIPPANLPHAAAPADGPFAPPFGGPPLGSPWVPQPAPDHGPQLGSTPTQGLVPTGSSPFHNCPAETLQYFPDPHEEFDPPDELVERLQNSSLDPQSGPGTQDAAGPSHGRPGGKRGPLDVRAGDPNTSTHAMRQPMRHRHPSDAAFAGGGQQGWPAPNEAATSQGAPAAQAGGPFQGLPALQTNGVQLPMDISSNDFSMLFNSGGMLNVSTSLLLDFPDGEAADEREQ